MSVPRVPVNPCDHIRGNPKFAIILVEKADYQCPYCAAAHPVVQCLLQQYGRDLCLAYRHFPLKQVHPMAETAAEVAEYAGEYGKFWEMHAVLCENQHQLSLQLIFALSGTLGLPPMGTRDCIRTARHADKIAANFLGGVRGGVNGTPTFFANGKRHNSGNSLHALSAAVETEVSKVASAR